MKTIKLINEYKGFALCEQEGFYFINKITDEYKDMSGTKEELLNELKRWRDSIDNNNEFMKDIENHFIEILCK